MNVRTSVRAGRRSEERRQQRAERFGKFCEFVGDALDMPD
jgi:hypothetical protein